MPSLLDALPKLKLLFLDAIVFHLIRLLLKDVVIPDAFSFYYAAKSFGVTEFVNPKDYEKPVQQVLILLPSTLLVTYKTYHDVTHTSHMHLRNI